MINSECLQLAADLTSNSSNLPAVATCTWCQSVANALSIVRSRSVVVVRFINKRNGTPMGSPWPGPGVASRPVNKPLVEAVRGAASQGACGDIGLPFAPENAREDDVVVTAIDLDPDSDNADPALSILSFVGGRSALVATGAIDGGDTELRVVIAESAAGEEPPLTRGDAEAVRVVMRGIVERARQAFQTGSDRSIELLNEREVHVLESLACGKTIREIAGEMHRSTHTIHDYLKSMHRKMGVACRAELIARAAGRKAPRMAERLEPQGAF